MLKLARWSTTHRLYVVLIWIALVVGIGALAQAVGTTYSNNYTLPGSDAQHAADLLASSFPAQAGDHDQIVFRVTHGTVRDPAVRSQMTATFAKVRRLPHVVAVISPYQSAVAGDAISQSGKIAFATVVFNERADTLPKSAARRVITVAESAQRPGLEVALGGAAIAHTETQGFGLSTAIGLAAAIVVLLITFGSMIAMGLPILTALFGLGTGIGLIALFTHAVETPDFSSELAAMVGLGVGIDYALFIVTRFREAYHSPGPSHGKVRESTVEAMDTAGRAVLFAGCTVVIALLGMMLLGVTFLYGVALSAAIGVALMMLASLTLLPALLTLAGGRLVRPGRRMRRLRRSSSAARPEAVGGHIVPAGAGWWLRWSAFVQRHPKTIATVSALTMLLVAAPATALRLGSSDAASEPAGFTTHRAYMMLAEGFGPGFNGPLLIVAKLPHGAGTSPGTSTGGSTGAGTGTGAGTVSGGTAAGAGRTAATAADLRRLSGTLATTPGIASVTPPRLNPTGEVASITAYPRTSPQALATTELVSHLREDVIPPVSSATGMHVYVGGVTATAIDFAKTLSEKLPLFIGVVVVVSALLLLIVFRSLVIPVQAAIMNLLSIGASLGVIVAIFQWGWLPQIFGAVPGPVESFIPVMLFAIVFGLSMDYEVFLVSRIHERWVHTDDSSRAVREGLALTGRVITAAATIMVLVFLSFMVGGERVIAEFGLSLASAVFLDAVIVRSMLLPAVLDILGARSWWLPHRLSRLLPRLNVEGSPDQVMALRQHAAAEAAADEQAADARAGKGHSRRGDRRGRGGPIRPAGAGSGTEKR